MTKTKTRVAGELGAEFLGRGSGGVIMAGRLQNKNPMKMNVAQKLIHSHLTSGKMVTGREIGLKIDQTLSQDATGTLVMLELEAMGLKRAKTEISVQYIDHNIVQEDNKNPDDHLFLYSAAQKFGLWFSRAGNGVSHPVHMENFGKPGKTLLGSDSHTPAAGSLGMLAIGAGGLEVALAIAGEPFFVKMPKIWGIKLTGQMPQWVSAKDVILEMLRRHTVKGGFEKIIEYYGPGLRHLTAMDRHVIANMGAELGATTTVFPADGAVKRFLEGQDRAGDFVEILPDVGCDYEIHDEIDLSALEPLIAQPSSPDNVVPVRELAGRPIYQSYVGSSANPGYRDFAITAEILKGRSVAARVSLDIAPTSRSILEKLTSSGELAALIHAGARIHQAGCNGCIGMGQAPATNEISLRTVPRNFPGRSGTKDDLVYLVSPETAAASALTGVITDPRTLKMRYPKIVEPRNPGVARNMLIAPLPKGVAEKVRLVKGPNIAALPDLAPCPDHVHLPVLLKLGDNISTDTIMPAGAKVLPFRSNIPKISDFSFAQADPTYASRARDVKTLGGHLVVAGDNYGQGSSREHAALAPRYLGLQIVIALSFARIHWQNLVNFGILPLTFKSRDDYKKIEQGDFVDIAGIHESLHSGCDIRAKNSRRDEFYDLCCDLSRRQLDIFLDGGLISWMKQRLVGAAHPSQPSTLEAGLRPFDGETWIDLGIENETMG